MARIFYAFFLPSLLAFAQTAAPQEPVIRITVNLVQMDAVVTGKDGLPVDDLKPEEFEIRQDGRPQKITRFTHVRPDAPASPPAGARLRPDQVHRTIAVVVDDLGLSWQTMLSTQEALRKFVDEYFQPGDLGAIVQTSRGMSAIQGFTTDRDQLRSIVNRLRWYPMGRGNLAPLDPATGRRIATSQQELRLYQAIEQAEFLRQRSLAAGSIGALHWIVAGLATMPGRKSVVLLSEGLRMFSARGEPSYTDTLVRNLAEQASRSGVVFYTIDPRGLTAVPPQPTPLVGRRTVSGGRAVLLTPMDPIVDTQLGLRHLAEQTGGLFYANRNDIAGGLARAMRDQAGYYLLGYDPGDDTFDRSYHKLEVRIKRPGLRVRSRGGFFGIEDPAGATAQPGSAGEALLRALHSPFDPGGLGLKLTAYYLLDPEPAISAILHVDGPGLTFQPDSEDWKKAVLDFLLVNFDDAGPADQNRQTFTVRARSDELSQVSQNGVVYTVKYAVRRPGGYQVRAAVRDAATGRLGSASQFLLAPDLDDKRLALSGLILRAPDINLASRAFPQGSQLSYACQIYNAARHARAGLPQLKTCTRILRAGQPVFDTGWAEFPATAPPKERLITAGGGLRLGLAPGSYVLQFLVQDELASGPGAFAFQWVDFQILP